MAMLEQLTAARSLALVVRRRTLDDLFAAVRTDPLAEQIMFRRWWDVAGNDAELARGMELVQAKDFTRAAKAFRAATHPEGMHQLALLHRQRGKLEKARRDRAEEVGEQGISQGSALGRKEDVTVLRRRGVYSGECIRHVRTLGRDACPQLSLAVRRREKRWRKRSCASRGTGGR